MNKQEFLNYLSQLQLSPTEAARLLSVTTRTVHRWLENPHEISGPAEQALRAWLSLKNYNLPWRPDLTPFDEGRESEDEIIERLNLYRAKQMSIDLENIIEKVIERGPLLLLWEVDLDKGNAKLGTIEITFSKLYDGKFFLISYRDSNEENKDKIPNQYLTEEAIFVIHKKYSEQGALGI